MHCHKVGGSDALNLHTQLTGQELATALFLLAFFTFLCDEIW